MTAAYTRPGSDVKLIAFCEACGQQVQADKGSLYALNSEIRDNLTAWEGYERNPAILGIADVLNLPAPVVWHVLHDACGSKADEGSYEIGFDTLRTLAQLDDWDEHMRSKRWIEHSTWAGLVSACRERDDGLLRQVRKPVATR